MRNQKDENVTVDSNYIQQHLANERTFLAWIRTAISIIGVGFLVTNLHFSLRPSNMYSPNIDYLASFIGFTSIGLGILTILLASIGFVRKIHSINNQTFRTQKITLISIGVFVVAIAMVFGFYIGLLS